MSFLLVSLIENWHLNPGAAHCVEELKGPDYELGEVYAKAGVKRWKEVGEKRKVIRAFVHKDVKLDPNYLNDVALFKLDKPFSKKSEGGKWLIHWVCPASTTLPPNVTMIQLSGWGSTAGYYGSSASPDLMKVSIRLYDDDTCRRLESPFPHDGTQWCGAEPKKDSCYGDSGRSCVMFL